MKKGTVLRVENYLHKVKENNQTQYHYELELEIELAFLNKRLEKLPMDTLKNIPAIKELLEYEKQISYDEGYRMAMNIARDNIGLT